jgi:hypothetical protein
MTLRMLPIWNMTAMKRPVVLSSTRFVTGTPKANSVRNGLWGRREERPVPRASQLYRP